MANRSDTSRLSTEDPSVAEAPILHVDLDAFFASVEVLDDPSLRGKPVAVGGAGERGVIASASYEARRFGVHSAMASVVALRKCKDLIIVPGHFDRYEEYSRRFHSIVSDLTPDYEPLGLDEVFADLKSLHRLKVRPLQAARELRERIRSELQIESGIGLGANKLFAKLSSKQAKPRVVDGQLVVGSGVQWVNGEKQLAWLRMQGVRTLWGVGPATTQRLERLGIFTVAELAALSESTLRSHVGQSMAHTLIEMAHGRDDRVVTPNRATKSIGHEVTFAASLSDLDALRAQARQFSAVVARALRSSDQVAHTISLGVRFDDLTSTRRSETLSFGVDDETAVATIACALLESIELRGAVRLLGVSASSLRSRTNSELQLAFELPQSGEDDDTRAAERSRAQQASRGALNDAVDDLRRRFGRSSIGVGTDLLDGSLDVATQRGRHAFGPDAGENDTHRP
jgi:DNA polymerase-4